MAKMGFRGRVDVAGIDLGTTNSVICVQELTNSVGEINCIPDPTNNSPLIPSVVSFLHPEESSYVHPTRETVLKQEKSELLLKNVAVGDAAKRRIDSHPHSTIYHAKRFLGRSFDSVEVKELTREVEFKVRSNPNDVIIGKEEEEEEEKKSGVQFHIPMEEHASIPSSQYNLSPEKVGAYIISHLLSLAAAYLGYDNIKSAVIAVPAKFTPLQRARTAQAFQMAGIRVARVLEEPTAAALAYGLNKKPNVNYIMVYDFGGGTLDVSVLHVSDGYVEVMASEGDDTLGGADFDSAVAHYITESDENVKAQVKFVAGVMERLMVRHYEDKGEDAEEVDMEGQLSDVCVDKMRNIPLCQISSMHTIAEKMKIALSDDETNVIQQECLGVNLVSSNIKQEWTLERLCDALTPVTLSITRDQFHQASESLFQRSLLPVRQVLSDLDLSPTDMDEVVMVGGTTRMPKIRELVKEELQLEQLNTHIDPDITVAYGAASVID